MAGKIRKGAAENYLVCQKPLACKTDCIARPVQPQTNDIRDARSLVAMMMPLPFHPFTLTRENESTALPDVGRPIDMAGRNVVKISIFFTCGGSSWAAPGFDNTR